MKTEYLLFNLIIILGPLLYSFDRRVTFVNQWWNVARSVIIPMAVFILWDALVTGRHWWFNPHYTSEMRLLNLPLGEWLFFITVPFACLFVWECLAAYLPDPQLPRAGQISKWLLLAAPAGILVFAAGKEYTGLVLIAMGGVGALDLLLGQSLFARGRTYMFLGTVTLQTLIFNGYLTARPVVLYGESYQLGFRILSIPIEDFFYGFSYLLFCVLLFEFVKASQSANQPVIEGQRA